VRSGTTGELAQQPPQRARTRLVSFVVADAAVAVGLGGRLIEVLLAFRLPGLRQLVVAWLSWSWARE
jgi:hypothetical protein